VLNKFLIILFLILLASCQENRMNSTTASCDNGKIFLIKDMSIEDVKNSLQKAIKEKQEYNFNINYSVISNGKTSVMINNIRPEELNRCRLEQSNYYRSYSKFVRSFKR
jgi:hypothetical protein